MKSILTDTVYKQIIKRITSITCLDKPSDFEELSALSLLAMDYETRRYDFSLSYSNESQNLPSKLP